MVGGLDALFETEDEITANVAKGGLASFLYLEVLDASFSFDGVISAFLFSNNLFIIALGLGIGAMFVRSMTIMMVEKKTLLTYKYLEHGAFYSILFVSACMLFSSLREIPEVFSATVVVSILLASLWHSKKVS